MQNILVQAQYWHDPLHFDTYVEKSQFIAEINNEKAVKNESYAINLSSLVRSHSPGPGLFSKYCLRKTS